MRSTLGVFAFGLAASVAAHEHNHMHLHERAAAQSSSESCEVQYYTSTSYGEWGLVPGTSSSSAAPTTSSAPPPPSTTSSVAPVTTSSSSPPPPPPPSSTSTWAPAPSPETTTAAPAPTIQYKAQVSAPATTQAQAGGDSGFIAANGDKWAFCYTPYAADGQCKTADVVSSDLSSLKGKGFTTIRTYANDCSGLTNIGSAARANGLKLIVGINIDGSGVGGASSQLDNYVAWGKSNWDLVEMVVVGNEAVFSGYCSIDELVGLIGTVKSKFQSAGYSGPVTTTEPLGTIQQYGSQICPAVDVIGANIHPYFNTAVSAILAGPFVAKQLSDLSAVCGNSKPAYCLETGWPTGGDANGAAIPGIDNQKVAISGIMAAIGGKAAVFSYQDDTWKAPGPLGVEQNWGCAGLF